MLFFEKYLSRGDFNFSLVLGYFGTWFDALQQTEFSFHIIARLVFTYLIWVVVFSLLLIVIEKKLGHPLFGKKTLWFYPWKLAAIIAVTLSLMIGGTYALTGNTEMTTQHIVTLVVGFLGSVATIMGYLHTLVKPKN